MSEIATTFPAGVEPAAAAAAPSGEPAAPAVEPAAPAGTEAPISTKSPADLQREAIYKRRSDTLAATSTPAEEGAAPTPVSPVDLQAMMEAEAAGVPYAPRAAAPPAPVAPAPAAPAAAAAAATPAAPASRSPLAEIPTAFTIQVDGRTVTVPATEVVRAGVATLQKETSADVRLQRVTLAERQIASERAALEARRAEIEASRASAQPASAPAATAPAHLPSGGANGGAKAATKKALDALLDSDTDGAASALETVIAEQVEARMRAAAPPPTAAAPAASAAPAAPPAPWSQREIESTNLFFTRAYGAILSNPELAARASARMQAEMASSVNRLGRVPLMELADRIGQEMVQQARPSTSAPAPAVPSVPDELAARRSLAMQVPRVPPSSSQRSITAPSAPAAPSRREIVQQMRQARHQT